MCVRPIGVFDSGIGGLNVLSECTAQMPHEKFIYIADKANMPYGKRSRADILNSAQRCAELLIEMNCKAIVIACNTATEVAIDGIRSLYPNVPIIGLEPAVKPCLRELGRDGYGVALVTEATAQSERFRRLVENSNGAIRVAPQPDLAQMIENCSNIGELAPHVAKILAPYADAEAVILGCSHYSAISRLIADFYDGHIKIYDGAKGAAERLEYCLHICGAVAPVTAHGSILFYSTFR